jgi:hypothetical protein
MSHHVDHDEIGNWTSYNLSHRGHHTPQNMHHGHGVEELRNHLQSRIARSEPSETTSESSLVIRASASGDYFALLEQRLKRSGI